jgi:hypothetical protein
MGGVQLRPSLDSRVIGVRAARRESKRYVPIGVGDVAANVDVIALRSLAPPMNEAVPWY